jgi:hypothetical protein
MDANKLAKLREIGFRILPTCAQCRFRDFYPESSIWGVCRKNENLYTHLKHRGADRRLSINRNGTCPGFEFDAQLAHEIAHFSEFLGW